MGEVDRGGRLEVHHRATLRVEPGEHTPDGAVLPRGVHPLQHEDDAAAGFRPEPIVELVELVEQLLAAGPTGSLLREPEARSRVAAGEVGGPPGVDAQAVEHRFALRHRGDPRRCSGVVPEGGTAERNRPSS